MVESSSPMVLEHLFRRQAGRIVSGLAGLLGSRNLQLAEDAVQEAMLRATRLWPEQGVPQKPEAWLYSVAHNYAITALRRESSFGKKSAELARSLESNAFPDSTLNSGSDLRNDVRDDELRMIFMCCHPALPPDARLALSLKLVSGFSVGEIARIFLADESAIAQRLVRAKRLIRRQHLPFDLPAEPEIRRRLDSVLDVIYLMFSGGYAAPSGEELIRRDVCLEALRLGQLAADSSMAAPRVDALVALMALQAARLPARTDAAGDLVLLEEQDRSLWDHALIAMGFYYFDRSLAGDALSEWHVQAAIAAEYAKAESADATDWSLILHHYDQLSQMTASPVVALNRAAAVAKVNGGDAALAALEPLERNQSMRRNHLYHAVRGSVFVQLGRLGEANAAFAAALECECTEPELRFLRGRVRALAMR